MRNEYGGTSLDLKILEKFLRDFSKIDKQPYHSITGGEPTMHEDMDGFLDAFRKTGSRCYFVTNAQATKGIEAIIRNKDVVDFMSISIDGPNAALNDATRGKGSFDNILRAVCMYQMADIEVDFRIVLHDRNYTCLDELFDLADKFNIKKLRISTLHPVAKAEKHLMTVSFEKLEIARKRLNELKKLYPHIEANMNIRHMTPYTKPDWPRSHCIPIGGSLNGITVLPDGKVSFCCDLFDLDFVDSRYTDKNEPVDPIVGDLTKDSLRDIMKHKLEMIDTFKEMRIKDAKDGKLVGSRQYICENCKFYCYKSNS
jgi:MoaA/NifB/PqqE/SkfB family radical SAM enzyme